MSQKNVEFYYQEYLWRYYHYASGATGDIFDRAVEYTRVFKEVKRRVLNLRVENLKDLTYALKFNILQMEFLYYCGTPDSSARNGNLVPAKTPALIEAADAFDTWMDTQLTATDGKTDPAVAVDVTRAETIHDDLELRVLWDFFAHHTTVYEKEWYKDVYIPRA